MGRRRDERVVDALRDDAGADRRRLREAPRRRRRNGWRHRRQIAEPRTGLAFIGRAERAADGRRHPERESFVEVGRQAHADAVEDLGVTAAHHQPFPWRPCNRDTRRKVVLVPWVEAGTVVLRAREIELHQRTRIRGNAVGGILHALVEPLPHADVRRHLVAVHLVGRGIEAVAKSRRDREVRPQLPRVLDVPLVLVGGDLARHRGAGLLRGAVRVVIGTLGRLRQHAEDVQPGIGVAGLESGGDGRQRASRHGAERAARHVAPADAGHPRRVHRGAEERRLEPILWYARETDVGPGLEGMTALEPRQVVDEVVRRRLPRLGERRRAVALAVKRRDETERHPVAVGDAGVVLVDLGEAVAEAVGERRREDRVVAERATPVVEEPLPARIGPRERHRRVDGVVLLANAREETVVVGRLVVDAADDVEEVVLERRGEAIVHQVAPVAARIVG